MVYQAAVSGLKRSHGRDEYWLELFFWNLCQKRMKLKEKNKLDWSCMKTRFNMYKSFIFFRINVPHLLHWYVNVCHVRHLHGCVCVVFVFFIRHMRSIFFSADAEGCMLTTRPMYWLCEQANSAAGSGKFEIRQSERGLLRSQACVVWGLVPSAGEEMLTPKRYFEMVSCSQATT